LSLIPLCVLNVASGPKVERRAVTQHLHSLL